MPVRYTVTENDTKGLNDVVSRFGFSNYKDAGVTSVPSGDFDLIRPGEVITIGNANQQPAVQTISQNPDVISSVDREGEFKTNSADLDSRNVDDAPQAPPQEDVNTNDNRDDNPITQTGDKFYDAYVQAIEDNRKAAEAEYKRQKREVDQLLPVTLRAIDSTFAANSSNINSTYTRLLDEQARINEFEEDRLRAYGGNTAGNLPLQYTSIISNRERESANEITRLENERNSLIAQARAARDEGKANALRDNMADLREVERTMRERVNDLNKQVQERYEFTIQLREKAQEEREKRIEDSMKRIRFRYLQEFSEAETDEERERIINRAITESGGTLTPRDFSSVYSNLSVGIAEAEDARIEAEQAELDAEATRALILQREASAESSFANAARTRAQAENERTGGDFSATEKRKLEQAGLSDAPRAEQLDHLYGENGKNMGKDIPESFTSEEEAEKARKEFVKKHGTDGQKFWEAVFSEDGDSDNALEYPIVEDEYGDFRDQLQSNEILVKNANGEIGAILESEFDPSLYTKI